MPLSEMSSIYIQPKDILKTLVIYFDSLQILFRLLFFAVPPLYSYSQMGQIFAPRF